jgi:hypothetical protein
MIMDIQLPKRTRLLLACRDHLYGEVRKTLATDKEIRALHRMNSMVEKHYVRLVQPKKITQRIQPPFCINNG